MNKQTRIDKIQKIIDRDNKNPFGKIEIPWEDVLKPMDVYKIPLNYLVYNKYNGRILSRTKSLEKQNYILDAEKKEGDTKIKELLWNSNEIRNTKTLESIKKIGQEKVGIITKDGLIIDGNRRVMLLRMAEKYTYFKTVVLDVTLEENPLEIEKLETTYQMGEDEKVGYNPIEKYLKAKEIYNKLTGKNFSSQDTERDENAIKNISDWMAEQNATIKEYLEIMETMDDYLDYLEYNGIYTQLDGREDQFINLTRWLNAFYREGSVKAFDGYRNDDVDDLKIIAYDYIRIKYEGKKFRYLAYGLKENHFFGDKDIWESFKNYHFECKENIREENINLNSPNLEAHLNDRDKKFFDASKSERGDSFFDENVDTHYTKLRNRQAAEQPEKLLKNAENALQSINRNHKSYLSPNVSKKIEQLSQYVNGMLKKISPDRLLTHVISLLKSLEIKNSIKDKDALLDHIKSIQRIAYKLEKDIKKVK